MPYCPDCGAEYRKGYEECADCGVDLVEDEDELFPDDEEAAEDEDEEIPEDDSDLVEIFSGPPYAANLLANALRKQSVGATVQSDSDNALIAPTESSVFVTENDYNLHDEVIQQCMELVEAEDPEDHGEAFEDEEVV